MIIWCLFIHGNLWTRSDSQGLRILEGLQLTHVQSFCWAEPRSTASSQGQLPRECTLQNRAASERQTPAPLAEGARQRPAALGLHPFAPTDLPSRRLLRLRPPWVEKRTSRTFSQLPPSSRGKRRNLALLLPISRWCFFQHPQRWCHPWAG